MVEEIDVNAMGLTPASDSQRTDLEEDNAIQSFNINNAVDTNVASNLMSGDLHEDSA